MADMNAVDQAAKEAYDTPLVERTISALTLGFEGRRASETVEMNAGDLAVAVGLLRAATFPSHPPRDAGVRALEWKDSTSPLIDTGVYFSCSTTPFGTYRTERFIANQWRMTGPDGDALRYSDGGIKHFRRLDAAKIAAQADYEARIRSALTEAAPIKPVTR